jgi:NADPH2 dehydrogenase
MQWRLRGSMASRSTARTGECFPPQIPPILLTAGEISRFHPLTLAVGAADDRYLVDQFTQSTCNRRDDRWGGSIENRARFALEVARAVSGAVGASRVGLRLSPYSEFQGMRMADPVPQFTYLISHLADLRLAYLHLTTPRVQGASDVANPTENLDWAVRAWRNVSPLVLAGGYRLETAMQDVDERYKDYDICIAFGRFYISTPDLPFRLKEGIPVNRYDRSTFYTRMSEKGYVDYPFSTEWEKQQKHAML